jgi:transcription termination factor Rho
MAVMERSELDASSLADLHAIADQVGLDSFRRLRKAELIDAILKRTGAGSAEDAGDPSRGMLASGEHPQHEGDEEEGERGGEPRPARRRRPLRLRRPRTAAEDAEAGEGETEEAEGETAAAGREPAASEEREEPAASGERTRPPTGRARGARRGAAREERGPAREERSTPREERGAARERNRETRTSGERPRSEERIVEGVVELLGNGSAFLRVSPPEASDEDLYISAAQVRRCELVSGDRVSGPQRAPRPSERYPSLARVDTINGVPAESVAEGTRYEDLAVTSPTERLELDPQDVTLGAIEWLTPIGRGSRVAIVGASRAGKSEALRRLLGALAGREGLEVMLVLSGVRPEEIAIWREGPVAPAAAVDLAASADLQSQTVEHVVDTAKRVAARGGDVAVLIDSLDGLHPHTARRVLAAARNLADGGSLTILATASRPYGGESTVIALDVALTSTGRLPALDLMSSGTLRPELLVGEEGAAAITKARAAAVTH